MSFFLETRVVPLLCWWHTGSAGTCWPKKPSRLCGKPPQGCEPLDASYIFPNPLIQNNSRALIPHILWFTSPFVFTSYQPSISQRCFKFSHNTRFKGKQPSSVVSLSQQDIYRINILLSSYCCYTKWSHKQEPKYRPRQTWPEKGLIFHKKGKEAIGEQRAGEHGWSKQQQTGSCKNRKTRQRCRRYKKKPSQERQTTKHSTSKDSKERGARCYHGGSTTIWQRHVKQAALYSCRSNWPKWATGEWGGASALPAREERTGRNKQTK